MNQKIINKFSNIFWKDELTPHFPLEKNFFKLSNILYSIPKMVNEVNLILEKKMWINKDKISNKWKSITLKGYNGKDDDFLAVRELGTGIDNKYKYTPIFEIIQNSYLKEILDSLETDIYQVRLLKLESHGKIKFHTDNIVFKNKDNIIRCHIPITTNNKNKFQIGYPKNPPAPGYNIWNADVLYEKYLEPGYLWYTNVNTLHGVENNSSEDRIHLVIDLAPTKKMLDLIG
jgi:hypothetical protein